MAVRVGEGVIGALDNRQQRQLQWQPSLSQLLSDIVNKRFGTAKYGL